MKMAKKFLAVALAGVMALSMLTGCSAITNKKIADELEGMLHSVNTKATVSVTSDANDLASKAATAAKADTTDFKTFADNDEAAQKTEVTAAVKTALEKETKKVEGKYVWAVCFATKDVKEKDQAQTVFAKVKSTDNAMIKAGNVKSGEKTYEPKAGDKYELGTSTFTKKENGKDVEYRLVVVTCKAVADTTAVTE